MTSEQRTELNQEMLPRHVAIIMDGNGRWAKMRGKARTSGHKAGAVSVRKAVAFARRNGIKALTLFAFSSENWQRPALEVKVLMELFVTVLNREVDELHKHGVQLRIIGDVSKFSERLQQKIREAEQKTAGNQDMILNIAANYGGRWDIVQATQKACQAIQNGELEVADLNEEKLASYITLADCPAPDLLIRTGGDLRISNFLLWQLAYAELYFSDVLWPDFDDHAFAQAINSYVKRERRFGLTSEQLHNMLSTGDTNED
ncbi:di-trans,poly-cis-decaprenylcistransferase [Aliidiomarina minuta]|uniref:Ditrans,polycis-undecaprenyl-diphosphate synthase ((2E,6E)-farnesyl-diphosphate specific) n=1 Tax=Aliidiomarina minuta TaxID=880057 RepID=A0A432W5U7_9GAMM|nr:polyprenyl diphosphate synthase [Aliidiomarina minuta]RUO25412.1 di-trans,poly-cis-decaprenylcistransferase [Aliidiomarina minuta]